MPTKAVFRQRPHVTTFPMSLLLGTEPQKREFARGCAVVAEQEVPTAAEPVS
jgi:hypothetical protein